MLLLYDKSIPNSLYISWPCAGLSCRLLETRAGPMNDLETSQLLISNWTPDWVSLDEQDVGKAWKPLNARSSEKRQVKFISVEKLVTLNNHNDLAKIYNYFLVISN